MHGVRRKQSRLWICLLSLLVSAWMIGRPTGGAKPLQLVDIILKNTRDHLLLYLKLEGAFGPEIEQAILRGAPARLTYAIILSQVRDAWPDRPLARLQIRHAVKYDCLKRSFRVRRSWEKDKPVTTRSFAEAKRRLAEIDSLRLIELDALQKGARYQLRVHAQLSRIRLPFRLERIRAFLPLGDLQSDWYTVDFTY